MAKRLTTQDFIDRAKKKHGDKYDYSLAEYQLGTKEVLIICPQHGRFSQKANIHLQGGGCSPCGRNATVAASRITPKEFLRRASFVHGDKYDYSSTEYTRSSDHVWIECPLHGRFRQIASNHMRGQGCSACGGTRPYTLERFIAKAREAHGDWYDYSRVVWQGLKSEVQIACPDHGVFSQQARHHIHGNGCRDCGYEKIRRDLSWDTPRFIEECSRVHDGKYGYADVDYRGAREKVKIHCRDHGVFEQIAWDHFYGSGCARCAGKYHDRDAEASIYVLESEGMVKVGVSIDPYSRLRQINKGSPFLSTIYRTWAIPSFKSALKAERAAHAKMRHLSAGLKGFNGATEWFYATPSKASEVVEETVRLIGLGGKNATANAR